MFKMLPFQSNNVPTSESLPLSNGLPESVLANYELPVIVEEIETPTDLHCDFLSNENMANMNLSNNVGTNDALQYMIMENVNSIKQIIIKQDVATEVAEKIASFTDYKIINSKKQILFKINLNDSLSTASRIFQDGQTSTNLCLKVVVLDEDVQNSNLDLELDENMRVKVKQHQNSSDDCPCHGRFME